jgi:hypothetical protein
MEMMILWTKSSGNIGHVINSNKREGLRELWKVKEWPWPLSWRYAD